MLSAALATTAVPAVAGPAPDIKWAWVTIWNPGTTVALAAKVRGNSTGGVNTYNAREPANGPCR